MRKFLLLACLLMGSLIIIGCTQGNDVKDKVTDIYEMERAFIVFPHPETLTSSSTVEVFVFDEPVFVYDTLVNHAHIWTWDVPTTTNPVALFDFDKPVFVTLIYHEPITAISVHPLQYDIDVDIDGNTATFILTEQRAYTVTFNDDYRNTLHLFTNTIDHTAPDPNNLPENTIYYGPGVHNIGTIQVPSNREIYIAGGAFINGQFKGYRVQNVTIKGRGIINGSHYIRDPHNWKIPYEFIQSSQLRIEGITFLDPAGWVINSNFNSHLTIDRINIITARSNGDGISLQSNQYVTVTNSFVRSWDDSLVVKNYENGSSSNIVFLNMTLWTDLAQSMEIGYETVGTSISNVRFENIIVINNFHKPVISIHNGDQASITNIIFRNILIENAHIIGDFPESYDNRLIDITIEDNPTWSRSSTRGSIDGVLIENVVVLSGIDVLTVRIEGFSAEHMIRNVTLRNIVIKGQSIVNTESIPFYINQYVEGLLIE